MLLNNDIKSFVRALAGVLQNFLFTIFIMPKAKIIFCSVLAFLIFTLFKLSHWLNFLSIDGISINYFSISYMILKKKQN